MATRRLGDSNAASHSCTDGWPDASIYSGRAAYGASRIAHFAAADRQIWRSAVAIGDNGAQCFRFLSADDGSCSNDLLPMAEAILILKVRLALAYFARTRAGD